MLVHEVPEALVILLQVVIRIANRICVMLQVGWAVLIEDLRH
jgi:hypothetical protein